MEITGPVLPPELVAARDAVVACMVDCDAVHRLYNEFGDRWSRETRGDGPTPTTAAVVGFVTPWGTLGVKGGRDIRWEWRVRPRRMADRIACCSHHWRTLRATDGRFILAPEGCGSRWCPVCAHFEAASEVELTAPEVEAMVRGGCRAYHITRTIPHDRNPRGPVLLVGAERHQYAAQDITGDVFTSVVGPGLGEGLGALLGAWHEHRHGGRGAKLWRSVVAGGVWRWEATGRGCPHAEQCPVGKCPGPWIPRWHPHIHALVVLRPGVDESVLDDLEAVWCEATGGVPKAQHWRRVDGTDEPLVDELREVLKYPVKPLELTHAQRLEAAAVCAGLRTGYRMGALHGASASRRVALDIAAGTAPLDWRSVDAVDVPWVVELGAAIASAPLPPTALYRDVEDGEDTRGQYAQVTLRADRVVVAPDVDPRVGAHLGLGLTDGLQTVTALRLDWLIGCPEQRVIVSWRTPDGMWVREPWAVEALLTAVLSAVPSRAPPDG